MFLWLLGDHWCRQDFGYPDHSQSFGDLRWMVFTSETRTHFGEEHCVSQDPRGGLVNFSEGLNLAVSAVWAPIHFWPPRMNSVHFWTGIGLHPFDPYTFSRRITMISMTTNVRKYVQELFAFLTNLGDDFYTGTISRAKPSPFLQEMSRQSPDVCGS
jgi:hypothetical protein